MLDEKTLIEAIRRFGMKSEVLAEKFGVKERCIREWKAILRGRYRVSTNQELWEELKNGKEKTEEGQKAEGTAFGEETDEEVLREKIACTKEALRQKQEKRLIQQLIQGKSRTELIIEAIREAIVPENYHYPEIITLKSEIVDKDSKQEVAVLDLSDLHIGKKTISYDSEVFKERLQNLSSSIHRIIEILQNSYHLQKLYINCKGDFVDNDSIYPGQQFEIDQDVFNQVFRTGIPSLKAFVLSLLPLFPAGIKINCVPGNHGRAGKFASKQVNWDSVLYRTLELALGDRPEVKFEIAEDFYLVTPINGIKHLLTHGNSIPMYLSLPYYGIDRASARWDQSIPDDWDILSMGHFHTPACYRSNTKTVILGGAFTSDDGFVLEKLKLASIPAQWFYGVHPERGITFRYEIDLLKS